MKLSVINRLVGIYLWVVLSGCASALSVAAKRIQETDDAQMKLEKCEALGQVKGSSSINSSITRSAAQTAAKKEALLHAAEVGTTHIVWLNFDEGMFLTEITANIYRCNDSL